MGLATAISPMPPVHSRAEVDHSSQNWTHVRDQVRGQVTIVRGQVGGQVRGQVRGQVTEVRGQVEGQDGGGGTWGVRGATSTVRDLCTEGEPGRCAQPWGKGWQTLLCLA